MPPVLCALRIGLGVTFVVAGILMLARIDSSYAAFVAWHVPLPRAAVWAIGATDVVCGALFALGALTRPVGLLLATIAVGAEITAGRYVAAYAIGAPLMFLGCVFFAWRSGRVRGVAPLRPPGVQ